MPCDPHPATTGEEDKFGNKLRRGAVVGGDLVSTYVDVRTGFNDWPWTMVGFLSHRRDLTDLGEPYLSAVISARGGALWFWA